MRKAHNPEIMEIELVRAFLVIAGEQSLNRAAQRLHVAQSTLTRRLQTLEQQVGGTLFERAPSGVALTAAGHVLADAMRPVLGEFDAAVETARRAARGQSARLRIGYLMCVAADYLHPALAALRERHPEVKVRLQDLSPGEQIDALRRGEIELAIFGGAGAPARCDFHLRRLRHVPVLVALPAGHPLATREAVRMADLRNVPFIGADERDLPGFNAWLRSLARRAGFRPRILLDSESLTHGLAAVVTEGAALVLPDYARQARVPGVVFLPLKGADRAWSLWVAWQRGRASAAVKAVLAELPVSRERPAGPFRVLSEMPGQDVRAR